ncbi:tyramine receptor Ser-2-like [Apostichopus japonicus]|uniref:tyramine receptor Ser-2-like n=1 Tax=Stichopus japonicus TaxID=307972 RepID=UPI003AB1DF34
MSTVSLQDLLAGINQSATSVVDDVIPTISDEYETSLGGQSIFKLILFFLALMCCVFGVVGNLAVIIAIIYFSNLRNITNYFIVSLAVADITVCIGVMPIAAYQDFIANYTWPLTGFCCNIWLAIGSLSCLASIWNLCLVSLDRYLAVSRPVWYAKKRKLKVVFILILFSWMTASTLSSSSLFTSFSTDGQRENVVQYCILNLESNFVITSALITFFAPALFIIFCYALILKYVMKLSGRVSSHDDHTTIQTTSSHLSSKDIPSGSNKASSDTETGMVVNSKLPVKIQDVPKDICTSGSDELQLRSDVTATTAREVEQESQFSANCTSKSEDVRGATMGYRMKVSRSKERKASLVIGVVVITFMICWMPYFIVYVVRSVCEVSLHIYQAFAWLAWMNSAINPVIYTIFNKGFRSAFTKMIAFFRNSFK